mgnify:CR=1 FL=1
MERNDVMDNKRKNVVIVPVSNYSFQRVIDEGIYAFPADRKHKLTEYIAFYRVKPVSSITHIAKISEVKRAHKSDFFIKDLLLMFGHNITDEIIVYQLSSISKLKKPVLFKREGTIRGPKYSTLDTLLSARFTHEL